MHASHLGGGRQIEGLPPFPPSSDLGVVCLKCWIACLWNWVCNYVFCVCFVFFLGGGVSVFGFHWLCCLCVCMSVCFLCLCVIVCVVNVRVCLRVDVSVVGL